MLSTVSQNKDVLMVALAGLERRGKPPQLRLAPPKYLGLKSPRSAGRERIP